MSKKIIKVAEEIDFSVYTKFTKDLGLFQVTANIWSVVSTPALYGLKASDGKFCHDISEIDLDFSMNNKPCNYNGFKELYEKLYGVNTFNKFNAELSQEFEAAYFNTTPYARKKITKTK